MNVFGMGMVEMAVVLLVAFLALGPGKSIEMARTAGKVLRDLRSTFNEVVAAVNLSDEDSPPRRPPGSTPPESKDDPASNSNQQ